ncbi:MAG: hypothetical protein V4696_08830 [Pseudomonadota bacterium]
MRFWRNLLDGLILWTAHFFAILIIASLWPGTLLARILVLMATILALAIAGWHSMLVLRNMRAAPDDFTRWSGGLALLGYALAGTAILYQGLPSLLA